MADVAEDGLHAPADVVFAHGLFGALAFMQLVVDAPDVVGLLVHEHGAAGVASGFEEGAALGGEVVFHLHVGDDVPALVIFALQPQAEHRADGAARAVGGQHVVGVEGVVALRGSDLQRHAVLTRLDFGDLALPAHVDERLARDGVVEELLDVLLLQVVHRQVLFAGRVRHLQAIDLRAAVVAAAMRPAERLVDKGFHRAGALENVHARARDANRPAAVVERVLALEQHAGHAVARKDQRRRHADGAGADDHDAMLRARPVQFRDVLGSETRVAEVQRIEWASAGGSHRGSCSFGQQKQRCRRIVVSLSARSARRPAHAGA